MSINLEKKICSYDKYETKVTPSLVHFGTDNTKRYHYRKEVLRLKYLERGLENSPMLQFRIALKKIVYVVRVQFFRILLLNPSFDDLTPVYDRNERRIVRQFHKIAKFLKIKS